MTECLFQYDRLYLNAAYHEPDEHRHLLSHMIIGVSQRVRCSVNHYEFEADGVCIDSDVLHTAYVTKGGAAYLPVRQNIFICGRTLPPIPERTELCCFG